MSTSSVITETSFSNSTIELISNQTSWNKFKQQFWKVEPYPHICIDDFLKKDLFDQVINDFKKIDKSATPTEVYSSDIELNKVCFESSSSFTGAQKVVECLSGNIFIQSLESLLEISNIIPLPKFRTENKSTRKYLHIMRNGGFLGSHVDQSHIDCTHIHILSCIFYASEAWTEEQGGHTTLFNQDGSQDISKIEYKPNRLAIFLHTSESFHGVSKLNTKDNRYSIYMDYYLPIKQLPILQNKFFELSNHKQAKYWKHDVIFFADVTKRNNYSRNYQKYLINSHSKSMHFNTWEYKVSKPLESIKSSWGKFKAKVIGKIKSILSKNIK